MKKKINFAIVGSNFGIKGYLPVIQKNSNFKIAALSSRNIGNYKLDDNIKINLETNWKEIFNKKIDIIISAVPPKVQEQILLYNLKFKKRIICEKPITCNYLKSKKIVQLYKKNNIKADINLTFVNHPYFLLLKKIIDSKIYGNVLNYSVRWSFVSRDYNLKKKTWKVQAKLGGGITNIFLTHVFSYCELLFGKNILSKTITEKDNFKKIRFIRYFETCVKNKNNISGRIVLKTKRTGNQRHELRIKFDKSLIIIKNNSKDWSKNFHMKINGKKVKIKDKNNYIDGRSNQIEVLTKNFIRKKSYKNLDLCLNAEKLIHRIK
tara:strand:- start:16640 stop:17602 length:963 start_codon:yes stop_codon:yes gene_type:complete